MPASAHHDGSPCKGHDKAHGLACCSMGGCPMMTGWLPITAVVLPAILPTSASYLDAPSSRAVGIPSTPTLPPPRLIV